ncbi:4Fe-4S ferredoxin [Gordonia sp. 852002-50816_SCH5313054-c]|uniref:4Fe-4S binding protein n=1 Tax=unclassified Gordonia (in: high G+C Gram-positive bacteria) TaxID=2657482 RepID=UPI0007EBC915|nr:MULTISPECIES: 4Fe-4S binding protein [unclassified Gordonia (in: high G+C Gram-positive bacteria)]OBC06394.1 4Fe-4S ferredoxin [Gordonia sp. 852002-50816_SCH5313054-a]OBC16927.1 4Fe-4S ferredoxin [Gordonia sp. 852002-50816_SCH5313054-c]
MPHVVTQSCCGDASCVYACPVNCIHPTPDEPDFATSEMLYIDPTTCVDCGACVSTCPVGAIVPSHRIPLGQRRFADINALAYAADGQLGLTDARFPVDPVQRLPLAPIDHPRALGIEEPVSVGIVGSGPSAMYAADDLLRHRSVSVTIYERLRRPFGLARYGVAPDHTRTRQVIDLFDDIARNPRVEILLDTEIGRDITLDDLRARHHAVIWAGGAPTDRRLEIENIDAPGVGSATSFVGWYNGHPDFASLAPDLSHPCAVVVGNGNVALDVARILVGGAGRLADTSIAPRALAALESSSIEQVTVLGRRGPEHAAFTLPELVGLVDNGVRVVTDVSDFTDVSYDNLDPVARTKLELLAELATDQPVSGRHIRLAFNHTPQSVSVDGSGAADGLVVANSQRTGLSTTTTLPAGLILTSVGYRGQPVPGLPFDAARAVIPHDAGRVCDDGRRVPGMYVTGWIKRGPSGFIGTNKTDSGETVESLLADLEAGLLPTPTRVPTRRQTRGSRATLVRAGR